MDTPQVATAPAGRTLGLHIEEPSGLERFARHAASLVHAPAAFISLGAHASQRIAASFGLDDPADPLATELCEEVIATPGAFRVIARPSAPIAFCAGFVLEDSDGSPRGTLCVADTKARKLRPKDRALLADLAQLVCGHLRLRTQIVESLQAKDELATVIAALPSAIVVARRDGTITVWNDAAQHLFGWTADQLIGHQMPVIPPEGVDEAMRLCKLLVDPGESVHGYETQALTRDGRRVDVSLSAAPIRDADGNVYATAVLANDFTERNRLRQADRQRLEILELASRGAPLEPIFKLLVDRVEFGIADSICTILRCNGNALVHAASGPKLPPLWIEAINHARIGPSEGSCGTAAYYGETIVVDDIATDPRWETPRPLALELGLRACWSAPIRNDQRVVHGTLAVYSHQPRKPSEADLRIMHEAAHLASIAIESQQAHERLQDIALHDTLTGLPNRLLFENRLGQAIGEASRTGKRVFLGLLDLDRFKVINDTLGHVTGDQLLVEVAKRLQRVARAQDTIARMGGDEFLFLLTDVPDREYASQIAHRFLAELQRSFVIAGTELHCHGSIGFSVYPDDAGEPTELLRLADSVMYEVKERRTGIGFFERRRDDVTLPEFSLEASLSRALENGEFVLQYQPGVEIRSGRLRRAEALLRWIHPELGPLTPDRFIHVAEESGLIVPIGGWMIQEACNFASRWKVADRPGCVAVRVSARQCEDRNFVGLVVSAIARAGILPLQLSLELSESTVSRLSESAAATFAELRSYGIHITITDFGTGSSNLQQVSKLPIDAVKIDRSFFAGSAALDEFASGRAIIETMVALGKALHLDVAADGVETPGQLAILRESGCDMAQGPVFAPPMAEVEFVRWSLPVGLRSAAARDPKTRARRPAGKARRAGPSVEEQAIARCLQQHRFTSARKAAVT